MRQPRGDEPIRLDSAHERGKPKGIDWGLIRAIYMRILGLAWLAKGIYGGASIIGLSGPAFESLEGTQQASAAFSAIGDCIAGVGLWLTVGWGAVTWIAVAIVEMAFAFGGGPALGFEVAVIAPILIYLVLGLLNERQTHERL